MQVEDRLAQKVRGVALGDKKRAGWGREHPRLEGIQTEMERRKGC